MGEDAITYCLYWNVHTREGLKAFMSSLQLVDQELMLMRTLDVKKFRLLGHNVVAC